MPSEPFRRHLPSNKQTGRYTLHIVRFCIKPVFKIRTRFSLHPRYQPHRSAASDHRQPYPYLDGLRHAYWHVFTFQSQLLRNIFTLTAVLRQFRTANSRFGTVTTSLDYGRIVADSIVGYRIFRSAGSKQNGTHSNNGNIFKFSYLSYYLKIKKN
ncbi:Uncharacterised protein [Neisseria gonorrhoeae]|uniref:Uncharacterized protein n=1 Tax=Neisseria gonorrhoeae TaxID=485 RepID=A0A378VWH6_NEIGO|nr:Uncharacterised protein [Neisseria gonorrhoeae]